MTDLLTLRQFEPHVGRVFRVKEPAVTMKLARATSLGAPLVGGRVPFDLLFVGPLTPVLSQKIYALDCEQEPGLEFEIFIVPIGPVDGGMGYQAIFT